MVYLGLCVCYVVRGAGGTDTAAAGCITACACNGNSVSRIRKIATGGQMIYLCGFVSDIAGCCTTATATATATIVAQATSTRSVPRNVYDPVIIVHYVLLRGGREVGAGRKVEYLGFRITDEVLGGACCSA